MSEYRMHTVTETLKPMLFPTGRFLTLQQGGRAFGHPLNQ